MQILPSLQSGAAPDWQLPPEHTSLSVQASPSSQEAVLASFTQPVKELQLSLVQRLESSQSRAAPATQEPAWQVSPVVQESPSTHDPTSKVQEAEQQSPGVMLPSSHCSPS